MITFEQARQIALEQIGPTWVVDQCGEYTVAEYGYEDQDSWLLVDGSSRYVIDGDEECLLIGQPCTLVDKRTGELSFPPHLEDPDRFNAMTLVGKHPPR